jgi:Cu+-exporting ATPase
MNDPHPSPDGSHQFAHRHDRTPARPSKQPSVPLAHIDLTVGGMTCIHCPPTIEAALMAIDGVSGARVNLASRVASIDYNPNLTKVTDLLRAIRSHGYAAGTATTRIGLKNMHCSSCLVRTELALQTTPGVVSARASLITNSVDVEYQPDKTDFTAIRVAIERAGYKVVEPATSAKGERREEALSPEEATQQEEYRILMRKFWFAAVVSIPVMVLSYPDFVPVLRDWMTMGSGTRRVVWGLLGLVSLPVMVWSGSQFFVGMWDALKHRAANMHTLISIGITAAFLYSIAAVAFPQIFPNMAFAEVFWDVTDVVVALVVLGLALEIKAKGRTSEAIKKLIGLQAKDGTRHA